MGYYVVYAPDDTVIAISLFNNFAAAEESNNRALAWIGVIPHWMYFSWLRTNQPVWFRTVVWTSGAACVLTLLGLVLVPAEPRVYTRSAQQRPQAVDVQLMIRVLMGVRDEHARAGVGIVHRPHVSRRGPAVRVRVRADRPRARR